MRRAYTVLLAVLASFAACGENPARPEAAPRLRISNVGGAPIPGLRVLFPRDEIGFGDVPAGATTAYKHVPNGVYSYAAYRVTVDGTTVSQPVIDWVGERPMDGESFTYAIDVDTRRPVHAMVRLVRVTRDE
jgi:hypothetical protein